jgi:LPXTG-site transpeptidase (sortase) family protein
LLGCAIMLLAAVRVIAGSAQLSPAPAWEEGDQEGVVQAMATAHPQTVLTATAGPAGALPRPVPSETPLDAALASPAILAGQPVAGEGENIPTGGLGERLLDGNLAGVPLRIVIPAIGLDAQVVEARTRKILLQGDVFEQWIPPKDKVAGWTTSSALLGEAGNTVISGHHNEYGEVYGNLVDVNIGDIILVYSQDWAYSYRVTNRMILPEADVPVAQRIENARWIGRSTDERLTLVTCWPKDSNTHRLILVASPN